MTKQIQLPEELRDRIRAAADAAKGVRKRQIEGVRRHLQTQKYGDALRFFSAHVEVTQDAYEKVAGALERLADVENRIIHHYNDDILAPAVASHDGSAVTVHLYPVINETTTGRSLFIRLRTGQQNPNLNMLTAGIGAGFEAAATQYGLESIAIGSNSFDDFNRTLVFGAAIADGHFNQIRDHIRRQANQYFVSANAPFSIDFITSGYDLALGRNTTTTEGIPTVEERRIAVIRDKYLPDLEGGKVTYEALDHAVVQLHADAYHDSRSQPFSNGRVLISEAEGQKKPLGKPTNKGGVKTYNTDRVLAWLDKTSEAFHDRYTDRIPEMVMKATGLPGRYKK